MNIEKMYSSSYIYENKLRYILESVDEVHIYGIKHPYLEYILRWIPVYIGEILCWNDLNDENGIFFAVWKTCRYGFLPSHRMPEGYFLVYQKKILNNNMCTIRFSTTHDGLIRIMTEEEKGYFYQPSEQNEQIQSP